MRKIRPKWPGAMVVSAILTLLTLPGLARDKDAFPGNVPVPPPEPNPLDVDVPRGGPVWITLSAYSITSPIIRYRIWRKPAAGQIGTPHMVTADTAVVKYKPPEGAGSGEDSFAYEVQSEAGVSAPAEVRIKITDKEPLLVAPDELDFGAVLPGEKARRTLDLQNIGGGIAEGEVRLPDGWTVDGDAGYKLGAGAKQSFTIVFAPTEEREYTGDVEYTGDLGRATDLKGAEVAPIAVTSGTVELMAAGNLRLGTFQVANRTEKAVTLRITPGRWIEAPATVSVAAKGTATLMVQTDAGVAGEIYGQITVEGAGEKLNVPVHAARIQEIAQATPASLPAGTPARSPAEEAPPSVPSAPASGAGGATQEAVLPALDTEMAESAGPESRTPVSPIEIEKVGKDFARVKCIFRGAGQAKTYRLEAQTVEVNAKGRIEVKWTPLPEAPEVSGSNVSAELEHLRPNTLYLVRLVGLDQDGRVVALSAPARIWTSKAPQGGRWGWVALVAVVLAGAATWKWRNRSIQ